ncbi:hypothetical protein MHK_001447 [Candidatus Magnetomorum sp. HK-1]|nr:hypothetical protein MHK_001447 [Candidatus Magnetomorum sp. HK-1]
MAFKDFTSISQVQESYNIRYTEESYIEFSSLLPSTAFMDEFEFSCNNIDIFSSETSRCENIIYPILKDVYKSYADNFSLWSHKYITHSEDLSGTPDYIYSSKSELGKTVMGHPVVIITKENQSIFNKGWGKCLAEMLAAQKMNSALSIPIHGIVTDGELWQFGKLENALFTKSKTRLILDAIDDIFGAIGFIIDSSEKYL